MIFEKNEPNSIIVIKDNKYVYMTFDKLVDPLQEHLWKDLGKMVTKAFEVKENAVQV